MKLTVAPWILRRLNLFLSTPSYFTPVSFTAISQFLIVFKIDSNHHVINTKAAALCLNYSSIENGFCSFFFRY